MASPPSAAPILVSGATGLVGSRLVAALLADGVPVRALSRDPTRARRALGDECAAVAWDGSRFTPELLAGSAAVVHLAGEPIFGGRLGAARRRRVYASRVDSTHSLVAALSRLAPGERPSVLACASAVGIYGSRGDEPLDESSASGDGFLADLCRDWEGAALAAESQGTRAVCLRFGIVLARAGGALPMMALPFRFGLGGRLGSGEQWVPWVHIDDAVGLCRLALEDEELRGPLNVVAPGSVRNAELTRALARALRRPAFLAAPAFALRAALGELSGELLGSRRVVPRLALERKYTFQCPSIEEALPRELAARS